jgi:hypothetical protein
MFRMLSVGAIRHCELRAGYAERAGQSRALPGVSSIA